VIPVSLTPIPVRITAITDELARLEEYPVEKLASIVKEVGFRCTLCGKCCTRSFNGHVFLLDRDAEVVREIDEAGLEPAPYPEFCDQNGTFYVSGYALKSQDDEAGSCWFLQDGRCKIYDRRFSICRIYPYMLHREPDETGAIDWRQISGVDEHGEYNIVIPEEECTAISKETKEYETAFLEQETAFLKSIQDHFGKNKLRHVQKIYDDQMRRVAKGAEVTVMVYYKGGFEEHRVTNR
jgi:hypothetical protein